jgi:hypothetical protein
MAFRGLDNSVNICLFYTFNAIMRQPFRPFTTIEEAFLLSFSYKRYWPPKANGAKKYARVEEPEHKIYLPEYSLSVGLHGRYFHDIVVCGSPEKMWVSSGSSRISYIRRGSQST